MRPNQLLSSAFVTLLMLLACSGVAPAALVIHGKDPIDTVGTPDGWSGIASFTTPIEAPPEGPSSGMVVSWTYGVGPGRSQGAHVTPLLLERVGAVYSIIGIGETREPTRDDVFEEEFSLQEGTDTFDTASGNTYHMAVLQQRDGGDDSAGGVIPFGGGGGAGMFYQNTVGPNHVASVDDVVSNGQQHASGAGGRHYNIQFHIEFGAKSKFQIEVTHLAESDELQIKWDSETGTLYNLRSEADPSAAEPINWPIFDGHSDIAATPPENILTIPMPADLTRLFVVESFPAPPVTLFTDDLESGAEGWTTVVNDAIGSTRWELGSPSGSTGPLSGAGDSATAWSTNLGDFGPDSDISLRSPAFDLSGVASAELTFKAFRDADGFGDSAVVRFLRAADLLQLGPETALDMTEFDVDYTTLEVPVPAEAMGENVIIEWNFVSDGSADDFSGLTIDDIEVVE